MSILLQNPTRVKPSKPARPFGQGIEPADATPSDARFIEVFGGDCQGIYEPAGDADAPRSWKAIGRRWTATDADLARALRIGTARVVDSETPEERAGRSARDEAFEAGRGIALDGHDARPPAELTGDVRSAWVDGFIAGREILDAREIDWRAERAADEAEMQAAGFAPMASEGW